MYWFYLVIFILAVLVPDIIRGDFYFLTETRVEELLIFLLGLAGFVIFVLKEQKLLFWEKQSAQNEKRLTRTTQDLAESYSYIGEVNRKMEIVMEVGLGLADRSELSKAKEKEIYNTIMSAASSLMKAKNVCLRVVDSTSGKSIKELAISNKCSFIKNAELLAMEDNVNIKMSESFMVASSIKKIGNTGCYLIIDRYDEIEAENISNQEMLKFLASQALFLYTYMAKK
jgi:hypothetical protein